MLLLDMNERQYFERNPRPSEASKRTLRWTVDDKELSVTTSGGVFSRRGPDDGTNFLVERAPRPPDDGVGLDLGCGWGALALALAVRSPDMKVWAIDVNEQAVELTRENAVANGCANVIARHIDDVPTDLRFDVIWSNPPIRIGKKPLHDLLNKWLPRLTDEGQAILVVNRHLGSDSLASWIEDQGWTCDRLASRHGYRILRVRRP